MELVLAAEAERSKYRWQQAAATYEKAIARTKRRQDFDYAVELGRELGFCLLRWAFQSTQKDEFTARVALAEQAFQDAIKSARNLEGPSRPAFFAQLAGDIFWARSFVTGKPETKRILFQNSKRSRRDAITRFEAMGLRELDRARLDYIEALLLELSAEWSASERRILVGEALRAAEELSGKRPLKDVDLATLCCLIAEIATKGTYLFGDIDTRRRMKKESIDYAKRATDLSTRTGDESLISRASLSTIAAIGYAGRSDELFKKCIDTAMDSARATGDNRLVADALAAAAYDLSWEMISEEIPERNIVRLEQCKKLVEEAVTRYDIVLCSHGMAACHGIALVQAYFRASFAAADEGQRNELLEEAARIGSVALEEFSASGSIGGVAALDNTPAQNLAIIFRRQASYARDEPTKKAKLTQAATLMDQVMRYRESITPFHNWDRGADLDTKAVIEAELSGICTDTKRRIEMLKLAASKEQEAIRLCKEHFEPSQEIPRNMAVNLASIANRIYQAYRGLNDLAGDNESRDMMIASLREMAGWYERAGWPSRAAETHWRLGQLHDRRRRYDAASEEFETASTLYSSASERTPEFGAYFKDYGSYMKAWCEVDRARHQAALQRYDESAASYARASKLFEGSKHWSHLAEHFSAWSRLESGEALSANEKFAEAIAAFEDAQNMFARNEGRLGATTETPLGREEESLLTHGAASVRKEYCEGRTALEKARLSDLSDERAESAAQYAVAAKLFGGILQSVQSGAERQEMTSIAQLCRGWQLMKEAEANPSTSLYGEAADVFEEVAGSGAGERAESIASANARLCRAMNLQLEYSKTGNSEKYSQAKTQLQVARNLYLEVGLNRSADWTEATMAVLDSGLYAMKAETAVDSAERAKFYRTAEKSLESALSLCEKAGYRSRKSMVEKELHRVKERVRVALELAAIMTPPAISAAGGLVGSPVMEEAKGLAAFDGVNIQARLRHDEEVEVGERLRLQIDLFNTGKRSASLLRVENISPKGFNPDVIPESYVLEDTSLNTKGTIIEPMRISSFVISLSADEPGQHSLCPRLVYVDEAGRITVQSLEPSNVKVLPRPEFEFKREESKAIFESLIEAFVDDYMRKRLNPEQSGWRSLIQIAEKAGLSRSSLYGRGGSHGPVLFDLLSRGLIETRTFAGQRGRGGEVIKARIAYSRDSVRRYVDRNIMKSK